MAEKMTEHDKFYYEKGYNQAVEDATNLVKEPNKMKMVAAMFGKQLGEEFWILGFASVYRVKFCESGVLYLDTDDPNKWVWRLGQVRPILTGDAEILTDDDWRVKQTLKDLGIRGDC